MKFFVISMLLLQFLLNGANAHFDGQTSLRVPLLTDSGAPTETTISCTPYSVEDETSEMEYVKYVLDSEEEENSTIDWTAQPDKTSFEQCASYAAEQNAGMFYFDGETCETSDSVYERKDKDCNSTLVKMVYMQKDFQPAVALTVCMDGIETYSEGDEWEVELACGAQGRKTCSGGVITAERKVDPLQNIYNPYVEGQDYYRITGGCVIKPQETSELVHNASFQRAICANVSALPCDQPSESDYTTFTFELGDFLFSSVMESVTYDLFVVNAHMNDTDHWNWENSPSRPTDLCQGLECYDICEYFTGGPSGYVFHQKTCQSEMQRVICCMIKD